MNLLKEDEKILVFNVESNGETLEEFLLDRDISSRLFRRVYKNKSIYVNGELKNKNHILNTGDIISILIEDETDNTLAQNIPLDIIYEDMDILTLNKPPFMVVHPTKSHQENTISNGIAYYFKENNIKRKIRLVNRLDMDTSGVLLIAKSSFAHQQMALQFEKNMVEKRYMAVVNGIVEKDHDTIDLPIGREEEKSIRKTVTPEGQRAITKYKVIERYKNATLLDIEIITGRSHQIRVHLNHIGHSVIGDSLYFETSPYINRQALHSYYLKLKQPRTKEILELKANLPRDMEELIEQLKL
ncbi:MAG: RluA family pseudouridine synthase [Tissierellia bacterium]|nr:RluA family pseudouridine synthase [Tissierellia bacterium]